MKRALHADHASLGDELKGLARLSRHSLAERWGALYGAPPPPRTSRSLMIRAIAYKLQERAFGGLKPAIRRMLMADAGQGTASPSREARPGTVLVRKWRGITHQVTIMDDGVLYRGQRRRSLSEVARIITGSRWSGPVFFGLRAKRDQA